MMISIYDHIYIHLFIFIINSNTVRCVEEPVCIAVSKVYALEKGQNILAKRSRELIDTPENHFVCVCVCPCASMSRMPFALQQQYEVIII